MQNAATTWNEGRGRRTGDEITGVFQNCYLMAGCTPEIAEHLVEMIRPILKRYGGIALVFRLSVGETLKRAIPAGRRSATTSPLARKADEGNYNI